MWPYYPALLARPVPRYTSYPTAAEFHDGIGAADMEAALATVGAQTPVSLYLHIPYCHEICWYCGCNTGVANRTQRLAAYLDALRAELALAAQRLGGRGRITRIAFGGGSPNAISPDAFVALVSEVRDLFGAAGATLSVELDPRTLEDAWVRAMVAAGVERASLGVQTLAPHVQAAIGRVQPEASIRNAVSRLRGAGVSSINFDLMYGLPGQSGGDLEATLAGCAEMAPERIALFGYAHVPQLIPRQRRIDAAALPAVEDRFAQAAFGHAFLSAAGYQPVGFDHFALASDALAEAARAGTLRRNFQGYTEDESAVLIGFGASAISQFPQLLVQNEKNAGRYRMLVSGRRIPAVRGIARSEDDRRRGRIIERILCVGEADLAGIAVPERLQAFEAHGLVSRSGNRLVLVPEALPYARAIAACFDAWRGAAETGFSNAI